MSEPEGASLEAAKRPAFAEGFPSDPRVDALLAAFEAGDFATVRDDGAKLVAGAEDDAVKRAAAALVARTKPDPLAGALVAVTLALLVLLSAWWITHDGPRPGEAPPRPKVEIVK